MIAPTLFHFRDNNRDIIVRGKTTRFTVETVGKFLQELLRGQVAAALYLGAPLLIVLGLIVRKSDLDAVRVNEQPIASQKLHLRIAEFFPGKYAQQRPVAVDVQNASIASKDQRRRMPCAGESANQRVHVDGSVQRRGERRMSQVLLHQRRVEQRQRLARVEQPITTRQNLLCDQRSA